MSTVVEIFASEVEHPGNAEQVIHKLVAMGWTVCEQLPSKTVLCHELIPGAQRIVLHEEKNSPAT